MYTLIERNLDENYRKPLVYQTKKITIKNTINDNDMLFYSLTTMMCFLTKEWYGFPAYTVNLSIKTYHKITYKEDLKII